MSFPPTFDNVWDITEPFDTELANLLGQNIRDLKDDVMQRMSLLSGILSNRPTPETVNATWGGSGFGILFFATDTGQVFQWNGTNWNTISVGSTRFSDTVPHPITNPSTGTTIGSSLTIPANTFQVGSTAIISGRITWGHDSGAVTINPFIQIGGQVLGLPINLLNTSGALSFFGSFTVHGPTSEVGFIGYETQASNPGFTGFMIPYNGGDVAANALTIRTGLTINGATNTTFTFDYLSAMVSI